MTDDNYKEVFAFFKKCQNLGSYVQPDRQSPYYNALSKNLRMSVQYFLQQTELSNTQLQSIERHFKQLYMDLNYLATEADECFQTTPQTMLLKEDKRLKVKPSQGDYENDPYSDLSIPNDEPSNIPPYSDILSKVHSDIHDNFDPDSSLLDNEDEALDVCCIIQIVMGILLIIMVTVILVLLCLIYRNSKNTSGQKTGIFSCFGAKDGTSECNCSFEGECFDEANKKNRGLQN